MRQVACDHKAPKQVDCYIAAGEFSAHLCSLVENLRRPQFGRIALLNIRLDGKPTGE